MTVSCATILLMLMNVALQDDGVSSELILGLNEMNEVSYLQGYFLSSLKVVDVLHKQH